MQLIFSPSVFKIFFLSLVLKNVASMCPRVIFFIFLVMGFVELPGSMALQVSSIFQCFYIFTQFSPFLLSFGDTNYTCIWLSEMFSQLRDALFFFFFSFFSLWVSFHIHSSSGLLQVWNLPVTHPFFWGNIFDQNHSPFNLLLLQRRKLNS